MNFFTTQVYLFLLLLCASLLQTISGAPPKMSTTQRAPQAKMLRAHLDEGQQPRFQEYPLLYALSLPSQ
ncbi:hypothetical protein CDAR_13031 [Caerostris darwini]|uniref:Uncharacterized protein n=1 Tax=Caerostris darwini TaxID=1538125 RepID=A0AAV4Q8L5_9ARAC|nr:hypothetical protein CDAR_13031 [Caerostris darwini]